MDFFKELTQDIMIRDYLKEFPETGWKEALKKTLLYGIHSLKALENVGLTSPKLEKIPALHTELAEMKKTVAVLETNLSCILNEAEESRENKKKAENSKEITLKQGRTRGISQKNLKDKSKTCQSAALRGNSKDHIKQPPFKLTGKEKPEVQRKIPKYLQNIDSKIKEDVQKTRKNVLELNSRNEKKTRDQEMKFDDLRNQDGNNKKDVVSDRNDEGSDSSFSEFKVAEDVKEFYQKEFSKLLPFTTTEKTRGKRNPRVNAMVFASSPSDSDA